MDIRTKLVFALVSVSLASMLGLGAFAHEAARDLLQGHALRQLDAVAESKKRDVENILDGWRDRTNLISSRTQLRLSVRALATGGGRAERERIERILNDARSSVPAVRRIVVYDAEGTPVTWTGTGDPPRFAIARTGSNRDTGAQFHEISDGPPESLEVTYRAPMHLDGARIGLVEVVFDASMLLEVSADYTGLGETGETLIAARTADGGARVLNGVRHPHTSGVLRIEPGGNEPALHAVRGVEATHRGGIQDYRGEGVWAATRTLPGPGWGIVVKIDAAEETAIVKEFRRTLITLGLSLAAFAIVIGTLLGLWFTRPILALAEVARRIHHGEIHLRAQIDSNDEVAELASTFNQAVEALVKSQRELEIRITEDDDDPQTGG